MFFPKKFVQQNNVSSWAPTSHNPIYMAADAFRRCGMAPDVQRMALLAFAVMNSAFLGYPVTMVVPNEKGCAESFLDTAIRMMPPERILQYLQMTPELIFHRDEPLKRRCILAKNDKPIAKLASYFNSLLGSGLTRMQNPYKTKYGGSIEHLKAEGPVSCILLMDDGDECAISHPFILTLCSATGQRTNQLVVPNRDLYDGHDLLDVDYAMIKFLLGSAEPRKVDVLFSDDLSKRLAEHGSRNRVQLDEVILRLVCIFTILNQTKAPSNAEIFARMLNVEASKMATWQSHRHDSSSYKLITCDYSYRPGDLSDLTATKVDYYTFWVIANGLVDPGDGRMTSRQRRVFKAIKKINIQSVNCHTFSDMSSKTEALIAISSSPICWASRKLILREVNADGQEEDLSMKDLRSELEQLVSAGHIERQRSENKRDDTYYVMEMNAGLPLKLPHPSELIDPIYEGRPVEVVNPLTGKIDII